MKDFIDFVERHKKFIKKLIIFAVYVLIVSTISSEPVTNFFYRIFGEYLTNVITLVAPFTLIAREV